MCGSGLQRSLGEWIRLRRNDRHVRDVCLCRKLISPLIHHLGDKYEPGYKSLHSMKNGSGLALKNPRSKMASGAGKLNLCRLAYRLRREGYVRVHLADEEPIRTYPVSGDLKSGIPAETLTPAPTSRITFFAAPHRGQHRCVDNQGRVPTRLDPLSYIIQRRNHRSLRLVDIRAILVRIGFRGRRRGRGSRIISVFSQLLLPYLNPSTRGADGHARDLPEER